MPFIPHTPADVSEMLSVIGAESIDELFDEIPEALKAAALEGVPTGRSEMEVGAAPDRARRSRRAPAELHRRGRL